VAQVFANSFKAPSAGPVATPAVAETVAAAAKFCTDCGKSITASAKFCSECGKPQ
jgi:membrane protease subunit (stomatin/prohibitin family)